MFIYTFRTFIMKKLILAHYLKFIGIALGSIGGYMYYYFVGCASGTCPITSNPYISTIYGALMGYLLLDLFKNKKHETD